MRNILIMFAALAASAAAHADSWDSNKNIDRAMSSAVKTYKAAGAAGLVDAMNNCYAGLDTSRRNPNLGRDVEYCVALDAAASVIDNRQPESERNESLDFTEAITRTSYTVERAGLVRLPEELQRYLIPRFNKIRTELPAKL
jgi:hypothetical protein